MAQFPIDIKIDTSDSSKLGPLNRQLNETDRAATGAATASRALGAAIATVASASGISQLVRLSDSYTKIQNSIVNVVSSTTELTARTGELLRVANQSRSSFEATAGLYGKLKRATDDLGISQDRVLKITDTINKGFVANGESAQSAAGAITQLGQALNAGVLRGDEFNSIADQAPAILRAVVQETGMASKELREFAATGGITAELLIRSIEGYADTIDREFARTAITFEQQQTVARNLATEWVGSSDSIRSASQAAGAVLVTLAENLDTVATVAGAVGVVLGARFAGQLVASTAALTAQAVAATRATVTYDALGVAIARTTTVQAAASVASRALAASMALLGGPVGVAILAASALIYFGTSAEKAGQQARDSKLADEVQKLTDKYEGLGRLAQRDLVAGLTEQQIKLNEQLIIANNALEEAQKKSKEAPRSSGQSFTGTNVGASVADAELSSATARVRELQTALTETQAKLDGILKTRAPDDAAWIAPPKDTAATLTFYDELKAKLEQQIALIGLTEVEQARLTARQELLNKATKEGVTLTEAQIQAYSDLAAQAVIRQQREEADKYVLTLAKQVAAQRDVGVQADINANLSRLSANATDAQRQQVEALTRSLYAQAEAERSIADLNAVREIGVAEVDPLTKLEEELRYKQELLFNAYYESAIMREDDLFSQQEYNERLLNLDKEYADKRAQVQNSTTTARLNAERAAQAQLLGLTGDVFGQIADKIAEAKGKESNAYKAAFIASKAAAIAQAVIQTELSATAALAPPPIGLGPVAGLPYSQVIRGLGYASVGLIAGQAIAGFANGGPVSGPGTGRSDSIPAFLSNGEYVMPAQRTDQYRNELDAMRRGTFSGAQQQSSAANVTIINNVSDVADVAISEGPDGELIATIDRRISDRVPQLMAQEAGDPYSRFTRSLNNQYRLART